MAEDIVVDASVWGHAMNPGAHQFESAQTFVQALMSYGVPLVFDEGVSENLVDNRSKLFREYHLTLLRSSSPVVYLFRHILSTCGFYEVPRQVDDETWERITQVCSADLRDKHLLAIAVQTKDKHLISDDGEAFPKHKPPEVSAELKVIVCDSSCEHVRH